MGRIQLQADNLTRVLEHLYRPERSVLEDAADFICNERPIHLLYRGVTSGAVYCAQLALEEVARFPSVPLEAAEFRQGPNEVVVEI